MIVHLLRRGLRNNPIAPGFSILLALAILRWGEMALLMGLPAFAGAWPLLATSRATLFEAGLPIRARDLFLSRALLLLVCIQLPILALIAVTLVRGESRVPMSIMVDASLIATLAVLLPNAVRPGAIRLAGWQFALVLVGLCIVSGAAIHFLPPASTVLVLTLAIFGVLAATWTAIPEAYHLAPRTMSGAPAITSAPEAEGSITGTGWHWSVLRSVVTPGMLFNFGLMALFSGLRSFWLVYLVIFTSSESDRLRVRTAWMRPLPLSRRARLLVVLIPTGVTLLGGVAAGHFIPSPFGGERMSQGAPRLDTPHYYDNRTNVPLEFWRRVPATGAELIASPWGETARPDTLSLPGITVFNPFTSHEENSQRFIEWQFERAAAAVYGRPLTLATYDADGARHPSRVTSSPRMMLLNGGALLIVFLLLMWAAERSHSYRHVVRGRRGLVTALPKMLPMLLVTADMIAGVKRGTGLVMPATEALLLKLSGVLPSNPIIIIALLAPPAIVLFLLLEWQFGRSESPSSLEAAEAVGRLMASR